MIIEKWSDSTFPILHNHEKGLVYDERVQAKSLSEQKRFLETDGQPIETVRQAALEQLDQRHVVIHPIRLQRFLENRGEGESFSQVRAIDFSKIQTHRKALLNELTFIGASLAQGFIEFYGMELNGIVESYERRLRIIEEEDLETGKKSVYISKISQGKLKHLSPDLETKESAQATLRHFQEKQVAKQRVATDSPFITLTRKREDDSDEKE